MSTTSLPISVSRFAPSPSADNVPPGEPEAPEDAPEAAAPAPCPDPVLFLSTCDIRAVPSATPGYGYSSHSRDNPAPRSPPTQPALRGNTRPKGPTPPATPAGRPPRICKGLRRLE